MPCEIGQNSGIKIMENTETKWSKSDAGPKWGVQ